jgi:hypothetical protein
MKYKHTFDAAIANLVEIKGLLQAFNDTGSVSSLEIDLVLQKTRNFYETLLLLKPDDNKKSKADHPAKVPQTVTSTIKHQKPDAKEAIAEDEESFEIEQEIPVEKEPSPGRDQHRKEEKSVLYDSVKEKMVLNESLQQQMQYQDLSSRLHSKPVNDLTKAIGINERFLYVRELFGNDTKKYEKAISVLNDAANFNDAYNYMIREYTWDMDSELVQELLELVRRKFITGQHE